jgi:hypothetical protein
MTEAHSSEVERILLFVSDAQERARRGAERIAKEGAEPHIVDALRQAQSELGDLHRRLMQETYYATPSAAQRLAV